MYFLNLSQGFLIRLVVVTLAMMDNPAELKIASGALIRKILADTGTYLQNADYIWLVILISLSIAS